MYLSELQYYFLGKSYDDMKSMYITPKLEKVHFDNMVNVQNISRSRSQSYQTFFILKGELFRFLLISLTISHEYVFFPFLQALKLNSENRKKTEK